MLEPPDSPTLWKELRPELLMLDALNHAGARNEIGGQNEKRRWSEKFADGCAAMIARHAKLSPMTRKKVVLPESIGNGTEPLVPLGAESSKRIDVIVADAFLGLEVGFSLKGLNYMDSKSANYDKNLTNRLYEMADEITLIHKHLPASVMVGVIFLPIDSVSDKTERGNSSFANSVLKLRERSGRSHPSLALDNHLCDLGFVGLYATYENDTGIEPGVVRFFDVKNNPPRRGRPTVQDTLSLEEMVRLALYKPSGKADAKWGVSEES